MGINLKKPRLKILMVVLLISFLTQIRPGPAFGATDKTAGWLVKVRNYWKKNQAKILEEYFEFLSIPNYAKDEENIIKNAGWLAGALEKRGIRTKLIKSPDAPPLVYGELKAPSARRTIAFYAHYDGQPVDVSRWAFNPWKPVILSCPMDSGGEQLEVSDYDFSLYPEARLYARSASDDKAPIMAILAALDALKTAGVHRSVNLKFVFEGEEEVGSPHLAQLLLANKELLTADLWVLCDGPVHQSRRPIVYFGARGIIGLELIVYGPVRPLHSGHYGNWAPNPASLLANLLAGLRDVNGKILVDGFYDDVLPFSEEERKAISEAPAIDDLLKRELKIAWSEGAGNIYQMISWPTLNIRGIASGNVSEKAQNAIPTEARASIDFRLVPDQKPERVKALVEAHLKKQGFHVVYQEPDENLRLRFPRIVKLEWEEGYPPARMPMTEPLAVSLIKAMEEVTRNELIKLPLIGGSIPLYLFPELLQKPVLILPIVNHDNNQHGENENLRLQNLWSGIEIFSSLFARFEVAGSKSPGR